jgi:hypothetical protein
MNCANHWPGAVVLLAWCCLTAPLAECAEQATFDQDFREMMAPTRLRLTGGEQPTKFCKVSPDGLRCAIPAGDGQVSTCGIEARFVVRGNFEIVAGYKLTEVAKPDQGQGAGVKISIKDTQGEWASLQRIHLKKDGQIFSAHRAVKQPDDKYRHSSETQPAKSDHGRLKLVRDGDRLTYSVADGDAAEFTEIRAETFTNGDLAQLYLASQTGGAKTGIDVVWTELHVRADEIHQPGVAVARKQTQRSWPYAVMAVGAALLVLVAALFVWRRRAR